MHTLFINTSKKDLTGYEVLFDILFENKKLVTMNCLIDDWFNEKCGYQSCVDRMGAMIDAYAELTNTFNLLIYIDICENEGYSSISRSAFGDNPRSVCYEAFRTLYSHMMAASIVASLTDAGRKPQNILFMFGSEKEFTDFVAAQEITEKEKVRERVFDIFGIPDEETIKHVALSVAHIDEKDRISAFREKILQNFKNELIPGIRDLYGHDFDLWFEQIVMDADIPLANEELYNRICKTNQSEESIGIKALSCPYDSYASTVNKQEETLSQLNIALHVLQCAGAGTIFTSPGANGTAPKLIPFCRFTADDIAKILLKKEGIFSSELKKLTPLQKTYTELKLCTPPEKFAHERFALDANGNELRKLFICDIQREEKSGGKGSKKKKKENENKDKEETESASVEQSGREIVIENKKITKLLEKYSTFRERYKKVYEPPEEPTAENFEEKAKELRQHHMDYLQRLKNHITEGLSNYAGKSRQNNEALLDMRGKRYGEGEASKNASETDLNVSQTAYGTILREYLDFCASRSVEITDIEGPCNWFLTRVEQIKKSINKIRRIAARLFGAVFLLYAPFFLIQYTAISQNIFTVMIAVISVGAPLVLLSGILTAVVEKQKRRYWKAWNDLTKRSGEVLEGNNRAVDLFDTYLDAVVPALRWVYQYKLDADYCEESCRVADAKLKHHTDMLKTRVSVIRGILSNLDVTADAQDGQSENRTDALAIDLEKAFCASEKNRRFYTIID